MKTIRLGRDGPEVSAPGLGTMGLSDMYGTKATRNDEESIQLIREALNMGINFVDRINPSIPIEDTVGAISDLIRQGKVKYLGLSEAGPEFIRRAHKVHPVTAVQVEYSLATRVIEKELIKTCRELGIGIVAYGVLSRGLLTGQLTGQFPVNDFRAHAPRFTGENFETNKSKVALLRDMAYKKGCTASQLALAWVLHQGADILPLFGTSKSIRLRENIESAEIKLTPEDLAALDTTFPEGAFAGTRYPGQQMGMVVN